MAEINKAPRGTSDVLPKESYKWQFVESKMFETASLFGFNEIRIPTFEHTEVFLRGVGDTTDVVQKEMYTFDDRGGRSITLRPEFTAGVVRSVVENGLFNDPLPVKVCYTGSCYRYEKPQAGRLREFHQFGVECFGATTPAADAEIILLAHSVLSELGIKNLSLEINSIGCPECRKKYYEALKEYFSSNVDKLCDNCKDRLDRNPMRIIDCKSPICSSIAKDAPKIIDYLCDECNDHFNAVQNHLKTVGINFTVNPKIVRGLDYYTKTVFEFVSGEIGAQSTVCGGGRYDGLVEQLGGPKMPSLGFAMGIERLLLVMESQKCEFKPVKKPDVYIAAMGEKAQFEATKLCTLLRDEGFVALTDVNGRSLKAQMKYANKLESQFSIVLGDDEIANGVCKVKNMLTGDETSASLPEGVLSVIYDQKINLTVNSITESVEEMFAKGDNENA